MAISDFGAFREGWCVMRALSIAAAFVVPIALVASAPGYAASARTSSLAAAVVTHQASGSAPPDVAFVATNNNNGHYLAEIDTINPTTGAITRLASSDSYGALAWSSVTKSVYFTQVTYSGEANTYGHGYRIAQDGTGQASEVEPALFLDVSADGRYYAYTTGLTPGAGDNDGTYVAPVAGGNPTKIGHSFQNLRFSHDGRKLTYIIFARRGSGIFIINRDGSGRRRVTVGRCDYDPTFSPDGKRILFTRYANCGHVPNLYAANVDGTNLRLIAPHASNADWSANGWLVYCRAKHLVVRSPGVSGTERVLPNTQDDCEPRFER